MKIMFVIGSLNIGGAEKQMVLLIQELIKKGVECEVFVMKSEGSLKEVLNDISVPVYDGGYRVGDGKIFFLWQASKVLFRLVLLLMKGKYNVLHAYLPMANFIGSLAGAISNVPMIVTSRRALGTHQERSKLWRYMDKVSNYYSDRVTVNSQGVWRDVVKRDDIDDEKLVLIYNGIDSSLYCIDDKLAQAMRSSIGLRDNEIAICMVANLIPYKGHKDALMAFKIIIEQYPNAKMIFIGQDRGIKSELEELLSKLALKEHVLFLGKRDDVPVLLSACDVALVASHEEGFCNALLEAMASGLPVVATDVGGNAEALSNGKVGILTPANNPEKMAERLILLLGNTEQRKHYGNIAKQNVEINYSIETLVDTHLSLYFSS